MEVNKNEPMSHVSLINSGLVALFLVFRGGRQGAERSALDGGFKRGCAEAGGRIKKAESVGIRAKIKAEGRKA